MNRRQFARLVQAGSWYLLVLLVPVSKAAIELLFPLLLGGWVLERWEPMGWRKTVWMSPGLKPIGVALGGYLLVCALSILVSTSMEHSLRGFIGKTLEYALFAVVAADLASWIHLERTVTILLVSAGLTAADAVAQEFIGHDLLLGHPLALYQRMTGPYENPSDLATYLIVMLLLVLPLLPRPSVSRAWRAGVWTVAVLLGACLVRTESQSAWMGFAAGALLILFLDRPLRRLLIAVGVALLSAATVFLATEERLRAVVTFSDAGMKDRMDMWRAGWQMVVSHPILGLGLNTFMSNYLDYWVGGERQPRYAHNCYLQTAAETGLVGLGMLLAFLGLLFRRLVMGIRRAAGTGRYAPLLGLTAGLLAFAVQAVADTNFYALRHATLFWALAGFALGLAELRSPGEAAAGT